jgi:hypothetical protein
MLKRRYWRRFTSDLPYIHPEWRLSVKQLDGYGFITLHALDRTRVADYRIQLTKGGRLWPVLLTQICDSYELFKEDRSRFCKIFVYIQTCSRLFRILKGYCRSLAGAGIGSILTSFVFGFTLVLLSTGNLNM